MSARYETDKRSPGVAQPQQLASSWLPCGRPQQRRVVVRTVRLGPSAVVEPPSANARRQREQIAVLAAEMPMLRYASLALTATAWSVARRAVPRGPRPLKTSDFDFDAYKENPSGGQGDDELPGALDMRGGGGIADLGDVDMGMGEMDIQQLMAQLGSPGGGGDAATGSPFDARAPASRREHDRLR